MISQWLYMVAKRFIVVCLAALLVGFIPNTSADDSLQSANTLIEGVSASGQVAMMMGVPQMMKLIGGEYTHSREI